MFLTMKMFVVYLLSALLVYCASDSSNGTVADAPEIDSSKLVGVSAKWLRNYDLVAPEDMTENPFELYGKYWPLITAGTPDDFNTMMIGWGTLGALWQKPVATVYVRNSRYTYGFMERNGLFVISVFPLSLRDEAMVYGSRSGRNTNKEEMSGFKTITTPLGLVSYEEATMIIECKKIYADKIDIRKFTSAYRDEITDRYEYKDGGTIHTQYIAEIERIWIKK